jgi:hypothetical protein
MLSFFRNKKRTRLRREPLPEAWWAIIDRRVPLIRRLSEPDRCELGGIVRVLLDEKQFEGCAGLKMTDEIRVTICAQAALLLLHRDTRFYPTLKTILVYPRAYAATVTHTNADGTVSERSQGRLGESWHRGAVVLSWDDVVHGAIDDDDGQNLVIHEFAHQLDSESGAMEGAPDLRSAQCYRQWARVLSAEYEALANALHAGHATLLGAYASTSPPEFFAVATEIFFEKPQTMRREHPKLYNQLSSFYRQDPATDSPPLA